MKSSEKRGSHVIDRKVQYAVVKRIVLHWCFFLLASGVIGLCSRYFRSSEASWTEFFQGFAREQLPFFVVTFLLLPVFLVDTMKLSHRFAGPMHRFRSSLRQIVQGKPTPKLNFRPGDFWHDVATDFNRVVARLEQRRIRPSTESPATGESPVDKEPVVA